MLQSCLWNMCYLLFLQLVGTPYINRSFFCRFCVTIRFFSSPPQRPIYIPDLIHYTIFLSYFLRKSQYFTFECWVLNKGTTGTIFITSLIWRGPWLRIEPGISRTRNRHYTTRLSRRRSLTGNWYQWNFSQIQFKTWGCNKEFNPCPKYFKVDE